MKHTIRNANFTHEFINYKKCILNYLIPVPFMLFIIGTGLNDIKDLTLRAIDALKASDQIFIDTYTSKSNICTNSLLSLIGNKEIHSCCRDYIESLDIIYKLAQSHTISLLIIGTPFFATTHTELVCMCIKLNIDYQIIHNASIANVTGSVGLYSYSFGRTVSIPKFTEQTKFTSFFDNIKRNYENKLHSLCLLDIKTDENYFMCPKEAVNQILACGKYFDDEYKIIVVSRFGCCDEKILYVKMEDVCEMEFGEPLHSIILPAEMDLYEKEAVEIMFNGKS